ncbi:hypothetical protein N9Y23_00480 [Pseudomonadales bacterium]|nr:hypothetical protein [Pseudomonadales bacterium]
MAEDERISLGPEEAVALWIQGRDVWNAWVENNPDADINFQSVDFNQHRNLETINIDYWPFANFHFPTGKKNFGGTTFGEGDVSFNIATFGDGDVSFDRATFGKGHASLFSATFGKSEVSFNRAKFGDGYVTFNNAAFGDGGISFFDVNFGDGDVSSSAQLSATAMYRFIVQNSA